MKRRRRKQSYYDPWPVYVTVTERREQADREVSKLRKKGRQVDPVEIKGRTIARSFWGKGWCAHLESFGDYSNRMPRGRSYVRNGSVCHLGIEKGKAEALVSGTDLYQVTVNVAPLKRKTWNTLKRRCTGEIGSLIELLQGNLSDEIMRNVTDREHGLFPGPGEIDYACSCPDRAGMCKHIAAVMFGIGARLDTRPELLFLLRGVDHQELISADASAQAIAGTGSSRVRRRTLADKDLESIFGVDLGGLPHDPPVDAPKRRPVPRKTKGETAKAKSRTRRPRKRAPFKPTARSVARLRQRLGLSKRDFARAVGVSPATVDNWEKATGPINPNAKGLAGLNRLHDQNP